MGHRRIRAGKPRTFDVAVQTDVLGVRTVGGVLLRRRPPGRMVRATAERRRQRENTRCAPSSPFYWLDTDWIQALLALIAVCLFDYWDRLRNRPEINLVFAPVFAALGAIIGWGVQTSLSIAGATTWIANHFVQPQGDITRFRADNLVTNWPQLFFDYSHHLGWALGLLLGWPCTLPCSDSGAATPRCRWSWRWDGSRDSC